MRTNFIGLILDKYTGKKGIYILKGITVLILIYTCMLTLDMALPSGKRQELIERKEPELNKDLAKNLHIYLIMTSGARCEIDDSTFMVVKPGDSVEFLISPWYGIVKQVRYYHPTYYSYITTVNKDVVMEAFPGFHIFVLLMSVIVLIPKYQDISTIMIPFFFVLISFIVLKIIMWS